MPAANDAKIICRGMAVDHFIAERIMSGIKKTVLIFFSLLLFVSCSSESQNSHRKLSETILNDSGSFFYVNAEKYPAKNKKLPIGIFDSGTGGLTVLDAIVNFDRFNNLTHEYSETGDSERDFNEESFIYLGDQANMPYGEYSGKNKTELLKEHVLKDVQFLLGDKYYKSPAAENYSTGKKPVKAIVIACNTATAYGKEFIEDFFTEAKLEMKVIGVIGAGVRGALSYINNDEDASIGVFATNGTVCSNGYTSEIKKQAEKLNYRGKIDVFQQAGIGLAAAIDGEKEYINPKADKPRDNYRGPSLTNSLAPIKKEIIHRYGFDWTSNNMLIEGTVDNPAEVQINSIDNYIAYHVVSFMESVKNGNNVKPVKAVILGCTHYPFFTDKFRKQFDRLYDYKENGKYIYRRYMAENIQFIDPAINTAKELYEYLNKEELFNNASINKSEFYISVPNKGNKNNVIDDNGKFTYEYKYGRSEGKIQEYVKRVPFSKAVLSDEVIDRLSQKIPATFELIKSFNGSNPKLDELPKEDKK